MVKISQLDVDGAPSLNGYVPQNTSTPTTKRILWSAVRDLLFGNVLSGSPAIGFDFVSSGLVITADSAGVNRNWSITAGVVYINGRKISISALSAQTATASRDTYVDILDNGDGTGTVVMTGGNIVTNNAASPALAANSLRLGIIVAGATTIAAAASINQGQEDRILPIASSIAYAVTDSLGNLICPRDANRKLLGYRQILSSFNITATQQTAQQITGLSCPVMVPTGRKVKITVFGPSMLSANVSNVEVSIWDGTVNSGTKLNHTTGVSSTANYDLPCEVEAINTPSAASKTFNAGLRNSLASNASIGAAATTPAFIKVELI